MDKKTYIWILVAVIIVLIIGFTYLIVRAQTVEVKLKWDHYPDYGSPDAEFIKVYELNADSTIKEFKGQVSVLIDSIIITINKEDKIYLFGVTAIDSVGNESLKFKSENTASLDGKSAKSPSGLNATWN